MLPNHFQDGRQPQQVHSSRIPCVGMMPIIGTQHPSAAAAAAASVYRDNYCYRQFFEHAAMFNQFYSPAIDSDDQRKLKSRDAARTRRTRENQEFNELTKLLPIPAAITGQLDKASIVRLTIAYLRLRDFSKTVDLGGNHTAHSPLAKDVPHETLRRHLFEAPRGEGAHILQALNGFAFVLSKEGKFLYVSETVSVYLGLSQADLTGRRILDYIHKQDHRELAAQLGLTSGRHETDSSPQKNSHGNEYDQLMEEESLTLTLTSRSFCIRMKSNLTRRGSHQRCLGFKVVEIVAQLQIASKPADSKAEVAIETEAAESPEDTHKLLGIVGLISPLPSPSINELFLDRDMFITRMTPALRVTFCESRVDKMLNLADEDVINRSLYHLCHINDLQKLRRVHTDLLRKGQTLSDYYRIMNRSGGYTWIQTRASIINHDKNSEERSIVAMNYVLGGIENPGCVMSVRQLDCVEKQSTTQSQPSSPSIVQTQQQAHGIIREALPDIIRSAQTAEYRVNCDQEMVNIESERRDRRKERVEEEKEKEEEDGKGTGPANGRQVRKKLNGKMKQKKMTTTTMKTNDKNLEFIERKCKVKSSCRTTNDHRPSTTSESRDLQTLTSCSLTLTSTSQGLTTSTAAQGRRPRPVTLNSPRKRVKVEGREDVGDKETPCRPVTTQDLKGVKTNKSRGMTSTHKMYRPWVRNHTMR